MSSGRLTRREGPHPSFAARLGSFPHTDLREYLASKQRKVNIALWAYKDSRMGDATSPPCCYSCTDDT